MGRSSGEGRSSGDSLIIKRLAAGFLILALVNTAANLFLSELNVGRVIKLRHAIGKLDELTYTERGRNLKLKALYSRIKGNPKFYKEKFIREYLLMFKKGEKVIPLPEEMWYR